MIVEVKIPEVGESITEGLLTVWLKKDGDVVKAGEELFELETDKITMGVPAEVPGRLSILTPEGETVEIGQAVARIDTDAAEQLTAGAPPVEEKEEPKLAEEFRPEPKAGPPDVGEGPVISAPAGIEQVKAKLKKDFQPPSLSPTVSRMLRENRIAPEQISGSGKGGRITRDDVIEYLESRPVKPPPESQPAEPARPAASAGTEALTEAEKKGRETRVPLSPLRQRITERLVQAQQTAAILTTFNEADMSNVIAFRAKHKDKFQKQFDVNLGFMSFFVKASVDALKTIPQVNARIEADEIVYQHYYDIGIAVGTEQGLVVPVIQGADQLSFAKIEKKIADFAQRARSRKLTLQELVGGCFTISNGGVYGSLLSTPILNPPQSGILGMHRIQKRPVAVNEEIVIRPMMYLALSYDHRIVDGAQAVTFLKRIVECIEDPERMFLEI
jgi:2-oxoglutarate dehydrogenase E2 component (dihydrolipoamide succinyltransferase)